MKDRAPPKNGDIILTSKETALQAAKEFSERNKAFQMSPARSFGLKSLYINDVTKHMKEMHEMIEKSRAEGFEGSRVGAFSTTAKNGKIGAFECSAEAIKRG